MRTPESYADAVDLLRDAIAATGDSVENRINANIDGAELIVGYDAVRGSLAYSVFGVPDNEFFTIEVHYPITSDLGASLTESDARQFVDSESVDGDDDIHELAGMEIMEQMNRSNREKFHYHLGEALASSDAGFRINQTESGAITGFDVTRQIYPYEQEFSMTELSHSIQTVVNTARSGMMFVATAFDIEELVDQETGGDGRDPRYLQ